MRRTTLVALAIVASATTGRSQSQTQTAQSQAAAPPPMVSLPAISQDEAGRVAAGWAVLAQGKNNEAAGYADTLLQQFPRSPAALTFAVEAHIAGRGASFALDTYERWLNGRTVEEPGVLSRIGRAVLYEWARQTGDRTARIEALRALAGEGVQEAGAVLLASMNAGGTGERNALVALGDPAAIDKAIDRLRTPAGGKLPEIYALSFSKSPRVVQPLVDLLRDPDPNTRAAAVDALGKVGRREATPAVKAVFDAPLDRSTTRTVHLAAAGALLRLGDLSGLPELREMAKSEYVGFRRSAAAYLASYPDDEWRALARSLAADPDPFTRLLAAEWLLPHDEDFARSVLDALLADANPEVREQAGTLLAHDTQKADYPMLRRLLRAQSGRIRVAAAARLMANVR